MKVIFYIWYLISALVPVVTKTKRYKYSVSFKLLYRASFSFTCLKSFSIHSVSQKMQKSNGQIIDHQKNRRSESACQQPGRQSAPFSLPYAEAEGLVQPWSRNHCSAATSLGNNYASLSATTACIHHDGTKISMVFTQSVIICCLCEGTTQAAIARRRYTVPAEQGIVFLYPSPVVVVGRSEADQVMGVGESHGQHVGVVEIESGPRYLAIQV